MHLIIYGELFAPDLDAVLDQDESKRRLSLETRLEFIKYCVPDTACHLMGQTTREKAKFDPLRVVQNTGPYALDEKGRYQNRPNNNSLGLIWVIRSSRWRPRWQALRAKAGPEFQPDFDDDEQDVGGEEHDWRQKLWEDVMMCQGLDGLEMLREELQDGWVPRIKEWRDKIGRLEKEPEMTKIGSSSTYEYPFLLGDLGCCISGYSGPP